MVVAEQTGCFYIVRPDLVQQRASAKVVRWVAFQRRSSDTVCCWASAAEVQVC